MPVAHLLPDIWQFFLLVGLESSLEPTLEMIHKSVKPL